MPRQHTLEEGLGSGPAHRVLAEVGNFDDAHGFTHGLHFRCHVVVAAVATERGRLVRIGGIVGEPKGMLETEGRAHDGATGNQAVVERCRLLAPPLR